MAEVEIPDLAAASTLDDADLFVVTQSGVAKKATRAQVLASAAPLDAEYVTLSANSTLSAEKVLATSVVMSGILADRPAASAGNTGCLYFVTDLNGGTMQRSNGSSWVNIAGGITEAPATHRATHLPGGSDANFAFVRKTADETVTSSAALQDDDHLFFSVAANEVWRVEFVPFCEGVDAEDMAFGWSFPAGTAGMWGGHSLALTATTNTGDLLAKATPLANPLNVGTPGTGVIVMAAFFALVRVGGTGGTLRLQWAQRVSGGSGSILKTDSYIYAVRVA